MITAIKHKKHLIEVTSEVSVMPMEKQIIELLSNGTKADDIRKHIKMAAGTFANLLKDMRLKYGCKNTTHLVAYFLRNQIIQ